MWTNVSIRKNNFEITLVEETISDKIYKILVVNKVNQTYFIGPLWIELVETYGVDVRMRLRIYLEKTCGVIFFSYEIPDSESSDFEDHSLRKN